MCVVTRNHSQATSVHFPSSFFSVLCPDFKLFSSLCPQSRSSITSVRSTAGSRGGGSWKGPSTRARPAAPVTPPAPVPPSTLPAPHQVREFTRGQGCVIFKKKGTSSVYRLIKALKLNIAIGPKVTISCHSDRLIHGLLLQHPGSSSAGSASHSCLFLL